MAVFNAEINQTHMGWDSGYITCTLNIRFYERGMKFMNFGGFALGNWSVTGSDHSLNPNMGAICDILKVVGVPSWEQLRGMKCRIKVENDKIVAIGNWLENRWFSWDGFFREYDHLGISWKCA